VSALAAAAAGIRPTTAFTLTMMGTRRGQGGNLKRSLDDTKSSSSKKLRSGVGGRGQEITGVTLPEQGKIKGWAFGEGRTVACANVNGKYLAVDGECPRCGFDLYKGKILDDVDVWGVEPHVACPTCAATYSLQTGYFGPDYKATGLAGFVNTWAKTATIGNALKNVQAYVISKDEDTGKVFYRER
jgi:nitrite reductase/ring-hydroxylating ferredoxin subunit